MAHPAARILRLQRKRLRPGVGFIALLGARTQGHGQPLSQAKSRWACQLKTASHLFCWSPRTPRKLREIAKLVFWVFSGNLGKLLEESANFPLTHIYLFHETAALQGYSLLSYFFSERKYLFGFEEEYHRSRCCTVGLAYFASPGWSTCHSPFL